MTGDERIAVIGAGIGGLVAAAALQRDGHDVVVLEQHQEAGAVGAGLTLFANAFDALTDVGLDEVVRGVSGSPMASMRSGQRLPSGQWATVLPQEAVATLRSVHRADLHRALLDALEPGTLRTGNRGKVSAGGDAEVSVDGHTERFDLVVVADGLRSQNRQILGLDPGLRYAGYTAWRGVTAEPFDIGGEAGETWGRGRRFGIVPLPDGRVYWFATHTTAADLRVEDELNTLRTLFASWHQPIDELLLATPAEAVLRHDIHDLAAPLRSFIKDRTVLLGDAAHAMTPDLGQGAGQAVEDAVTLALLLRSTPIDEALSRYDALRRPRTRVLWKRSRQMGAMGQLAHPVGVRLRDTAVRATPDRLVSVASERLQSWTPPLP